ncbi:MAG TPA: hypothetical protein VNX28_17805 [Gemmataceae bacterium]|nr:hypothetical protein [Gemmataceae bacterium]
MSTREDYGFRRTKCGCEFCRAPCRHMPGSLDVTDITRLCPPGQDVFAWAEQHLRALTDKPYPTLVPARQDNGACHWLCGGLCAVHDDAPFSCAFFDMHMTEEEIEARSAATIQARQDDAARNGLYQRVWLHLCREGLIGVPGNRAALAEELRVLRSRTET